MQFDATLTPAQIRTLHDVISRFPAVGQIGLQYIDGDWRVVTLVEGLDTEAHSFELDGEGVMHPRSYAV